MSAPADSTSSVPSSALAAQGPGTSRAVAASFRNLLGGEVVNKGARFIAAAVLARALSRSAYGAFNVGIAAAGIATAATTLGLGEIAGRRAAIAQSRSAWLAGRVLLARWSAIVPLALAAVAVSAIVWPGHVGVVAVTGAVAIGTVSSGDWLGRALQRTGGVAMASALGGVVAALAAALVLAVGGSYVAALGGFAVAEFVTSLFCWRAVRQIGVPELGLTGARPLLREAWPIAISSLVIYSYYANLDTIILSSSHGTATAGIYSAAYRVFLVFNSIAIFVAYANFPTLSRASVNRDDPSAARTLHNNIYYLFAFGAIAAGAAVLFGGDLLALMFGDPFRAGAHTFAILCIGTLWYLVGFPLGYSLIASAHNRRFLAGAAVAGILSVSLDVALIPPYGMMGAAIANAVCFVAGASVWIIGYQRLDRSLAAVVAGICACTAGVAVAVAVPSSHVVLGILVASAGIATTVFALRERREREA